LCETPTHGCTARPPDGLFPLGLSLSSNFFSLTSVFFSSVPRTIDFSRSCGRPPFSLTRALSETEQLTSPYCQVDSLRFFALAFHSTITPPFFLVLISPFDTSVRNSPRYRQRFLSAFTVLSFDTVVRIVPVSESPDTSLRRPPCTFSVGRDYETPVPRSSWSAWRLWLSDPLPANTFPRTLFLGVAAGFVDSV